MKKIFYILLLLFAFNSCSDTVSDSISDSDRFVAIYDQNFISDHNFNSLYILKDTKTGISYLVVKSPNGISVTRLYY